MPCLLGKWANEPFDDRLPSCGPKVWPGRRRAHGRDSRNLTCRLMDLGLFPRTFSGQCSGSRIGSFHQSLRGCERGAKMDRCRERPTISRLGDKVDCIRPAQRGDVRGNLPATMVGPSTRRAGAATSRRTRSAQRQIDRTRPVETISAAPR